MLQCETRVGDYEILDLLQSSRREVVYRVRNTTANRLEAMKVLPESLEHDNETSERFFREIKVLARLTHPNIVTFYHATKLGNQMVMTTELLDGITLAEKLEEGRLPLRKAIDIIEQVLAALGHAHSQNVVHREVTPENIWILHNGSVKLGGFGLAKGKQDMTLTQEGTSLGAVAYMSPEQVKGTGDIAFSTDIYAAGCVLYEMLTGKKPFTAKSDFDVMLAHVQRDPVPAYMLNAEIPAGVQQALHKAMAKDPAQRFSACLAFSSALEQSMSKRFEQVQSEGATPMRSPERTLPAHPSPGGGRIVAVETAPDYVMWVLAAALVLTITWLFWTFTN
jgi:eukaryotic-like serine/threonine-protein kinase